MGVGELRASRRSIRRVTVVAACLLLSALLPAAASGASSSRPALAPARTSEPAVDSPVVSAAVDPAIPAAPDTAGSWGPVLDWGFQGKHMVALPTGKVLVWSTGDNARVWDPGTNAFTPVPATFGDLHCADQ